VDADMSELYGDAHRAFQDQHDTRRLADRLESLAHAQFDPGEQAFIESAPFFFLSSVDERGRPTVSYKGGAPGFVRVVEPGALIFPAFDGNGMFLTLGNIATTAQVGLLFISFETPRRLRVQGKARVLPNEGPHHVPGAMYLVRIEADQIFVNCGRYIHKLESASLSRHVPDAGGRQPFPAWKRIDILAETLNDSDKAKVAQAGGPIAHELYRGEDAPPAE
jgi:hypothetical protein